jgi:para-nitrobenzyl esterase
MRPPGTRSRLATEPPRPTRDGASSKETVILPTAGPATCVIDTASGRVRGAVQDGVCALRGIPYGADTSGAQRFRPPQPIAWTGVRDAFRLGPRCPQKEADHIPDYEIWRQDSTPASEDCLVLNVFTPAPDETSRLPVMVFFHPGGFHVGTSGPACMDGSALARRGVVVVTLNHRLGIFGHLSLADEPGSGNAGMLDCIAALEWVKLNIARFGGDPGNVTIFGQSGGGSKVAVLMAMPRARGLFHKAIIQSASSLLALATRDEAERNTHHLLAALGLAGAPATRMQRELRALPASALLKAMTAAIRSAGLIDNYRPVVDGADVPSQPFDPEALKLSGDVPLLTGWCENEQRLIWAATPEVYESSAQSVLKGVARFVGVSREHAALLLEAYRECRPRDRAGDHFAQIVGDHRYRRNVSAAADRQAAHGRAPVYRYVLSWPTPVHGGLLRAPHTLCIPFTFATAASAAALVGTGPEPLALQEQMAGAWVAFAHSGEPNHAALPHWRPYDVRDRATMVFDRETRLVADPWRHERLAFESLPPYRPAGYEGGQKP